MSPKIERISSSTEAALQSVEHHEHNLCFALEPNRKTDKGWMQRREKIKCRRCIYDAGVESLFL